MHWINKSAALNEMCRAIKGEPYIAVDTEFVRRHTYYPQLALIQIQTSRDCFLVDPLAEGVNLAPLKDVLLDPKILKLFHAAFQDLEIFHTLWGEILTPFMDTQILAMVAGFEENISYQALCERMLGVSLDKKFQFMNWKKRPLSEEETAYAAGDVQHLYALFPKLKEQAGEKYAWVEQDMAFYEEESVFAFDPLKTWKKFKKPADLTGLASLIRLYFLVMWRDKRAQKSDRLPKYILPDAALSALASPEIKSPKAAKRVILKHEGGEKSQRHTDAIWAELERADALKASDAKALLNAKPRKQPLDKEKREVVKKAFHEKAEALGIVPSLLARSKDIDQFLRGEASRLDKGWRQGVIQEVMSGLEK